MSPRRISLVSNASGSGKTTLGRTLAAMIDAPHVELDALVHGPSWSETPDDVLQQRVATIIAGERWVIDGNYRNKLGSLVVSSADLVVWLDMPLAVWLPRLLRRTLRRALTREPLWNGNRESLRSVLWGRDSLFAFALRNYRPRRAEFADWLAPYPHVRLRSPADVARFVASFEASLSR